MLCRLSGREAKGAQSGGGVVVTALLTDAVTAPERELCMLTTMDTDDAVEIASSDSDFSDISSDTEHDKAHALEQLDRILSQRLHTPITAAAPSLPTLDPSLTKKQRQRLKKKQAKEDVEGAILSRKPSPA